MLLRSRFGAPALLAAAALLFALPACDELTGDGNTDDELEHDPALVGEWIAVSALYTNQQNAAQTFDAVTQAGAFLFLEINADGTIALTEWDADIHGMAEDAGTWSTENGNLIIDWNSEDASETIPYRLVNDHLVVEVGEEDFDFNDDGTDDLADFVVTFADITASPDPDLVGTWGGTTMTFTSVADPGTSVEVIQHGAAFTLQANADGTYSVEITYPDGTGTYTETESGVYTALEGLLWVYDSGSNDPEIALLFYAVDGSSATLSHDWDEAFDFDDDGIDEPATLEIILTKQ